ncbi:MAG: hypothetical protein WDN26_22515 [Chitinophagaceae bacterium]
MNSPEILENVTIPVTELLPVPVPEQHKKRFFNSNQLKPVLLLIAVYSLIFNQVQQNKKQASIKGISSMAAIVKAIKNIPAQAKDEEWKYQTAVFQLK